MLWLSHIPVPEGSGLGLGWSTQRNQDQFPCTGQLYQNQNKLKTLNLLSGRNFSASDNSCWQNPLVTSWSLPVRAHPTPHTSELWACHGSDNVFVDYLLVWEAWDAAGNPEIRQNARNFQSAVSMQTLSHWKGTRIVFPSFSHPYPPPTHGHLCGRTRTHTKHISMQTS